MTTTLANGEKMVENSSVELDLNEGTRLIWIEGKGYILTSEAFKTLAEIQEDINNLKPLEE